MSQKNEWKSDKQRDFFNKIINAEGATLHPVEKQVKSRLRFQRDRDRIVWSRSFKRLAHKTQIFPHAYSDHQRHRLTHSLEVMQLSSSIARYLGLNALLCEAIALGHDLGHTPFGHAGEWSIDNALKHLVSECIPSNIRGLERFTHYEQGVDVASYMDSTNPEVIVDGLRLSKEVREGILKHTYDYLSDDKKHKSLSFLSKHTKYCDLKEGFGSLESQVVRICDKISYFISDIEDGLSIGAFHVSDLYDYDIFKKHLVREENRHSSCNKDGQLFHLVRDKILTELIESILKNNLPKFDVNLNLSIYPNEEVRNQMSSIYKELMTKKFFNRNILVTRDNRRAEHIVSCLICQYIRHPELIPWEFRSRYLITDTEYSSNLYYQKIKELYLKDSNDDDLLNEIELDFDLWFGNTRNKECTYCEDPICPEGKHKKIPCLPITLICIKDFIAGMTDNYAETRYRNDVDCYYSKRAWVNHGMDRREFHNIAIIRQN